MMEERFVKANELLLKEDFIEKLKQAEDDKSVQKLFSDNGVELSLEDISNMVDESHKIHEMNEKNELDENDVENVTGGAILVSSLVCLAVGAGGVGFFSAYGYRRYIKRS